MKSRLGKPGFRTRDGGWDGHPVKPLDVAFDLVPYSCG